MIGKSWACTPGPQRATGWALKEFKTAFENKPTSFFWCSVYRRTTQPPAYSLHPDIKPRKYQSFGCEAGCSPTQIYICLTIQVKLYLFVCNYFNIWNWFSDFFFFKKPFSYFYHNAMMWLNVKKHKCFYLFIILVFTFKIDFLCIFKWRIV